MRQVLEAGIVMAYNSLGRVKTKTSRPKKTISLRNARNTDGSSSTKITVGYLSVNSSPLATIHLSKRCACSHFLHYDLRYA